MKKIVKNEKGQGLLEYLLLIALVAFGSIVVLSNFGVKIEKRIRKANDSLQNVEIQPYSGRNKNG